MIVFTIVPASSTHYLESNRNEIARRASFFIKEEKLMSLKYHTERIDGRHRAKPDDKINLFPAGARKEKESVARHSFHLPRSPIARRIL